MEAVERATCAVCRRPMPRPALVEVRVETRGVIGRAWINWLVCAVTCEAVARARAETWVGPIEKAIHGVPA